MNEPRRRVFLINLAIWMAGAALCALPFPVVAGSSTAGPPPVAMHWLGGQAPLVPSGVAWGVPWPRGVVAKETPVIVRDGSGNEIPAQAWPLAYWPDGSIKWTGMAIAANVETTGLTVEIGDKSGILPKAAITVSEEAADIVVRNGPLTARIGKMGQSLIDSLTVEGREIARDGRLVARREDRSQFAAQGILREEDYVGKITRATVEQAGPVRAVIHVEGVHAGQGGLAREWLPFSVRFYFTAGVASVRVVHSFVFDGDQDTDFIKGLGLAFSVPFREELQNRHVRFATGDENVFAEPVVLAPGHRPGRMPEGAEYQRAQLAGRRIPNLAELPERERTGMTGMPVWDGFKITQLEADSWGLYKRTGARSSWLHITSGGRSRGLAFLGDVTGGLTVGVKRFWQKYPAAFEIDNASTDTGELRVWFWSPDAPAMDLRHYSTARYDTDVTYEDPRPVERADALGCANTTELTLWGTPDTPGPEVLDAMTKTSNEPRLPVCSPEYYHATRTLGLWSLPGVPAAGLSDADLKSAETQLDRAFAFYADETERRRWYGFWDYGDYRRTYDPIRHQWMYDIGGHGWNSTELTPDLWLWFAFLRSGRADIFRAAEAMTRNTQEVDVYHLGRFAGLGNRHNVTHWGDGAKEPRISQAHLKRIYYYLTTDERTGDLMREVLAAVEKSTGRELNNTREEGPEITIRLAPDWQAFASNWFAEWERTGDVRYRDYCLAGMKDIAAMTDRQIGDGTFTFDLETKQLRPKGRNRNQHFLVLFGGDQVVHDLVSNIPCPEFEQAWNRLLEKHVEPSSNNKYAESRMTAHVAKETGRADLKDQAVRLYHDLLQAVDGDRYPEKWIRLDDATVTQPAVERPVGDSSTAAGIVETPGTAQWALNLITIPELLRESALSAKRDSVDASR